MRDCYLPGIPWEDCVDGWIINKKNPEEIVERRFTEDCQLTPEIATYEAWIVETEQK